MATRQEVAASQARASDARARRFGARGGLGTTATKRGGGGGPSRGGGLLELLLGGLVGGAIGPDHDGWGMTGVGVGDEDIVLAIHVEAQTGHRDELGDRHVAADPLVEPRYQRRGGVNVGRKDAQGALEV